MASLSDQYENAVLNAILGDNRAPNMPGTVYVALFTSAPNDAGGGTEVSGNGYARVAVANSTANWPNASGGVKYNASLVTFPTATGSWGTVGWMALMDAETDGNIILHAELASTISPVTGNTPFFDLSSIVVSAD